MVPTDLLRMDIAPIEYQGSIESLDSKNEDKTDFSPEFKRWLGNFVDVFNENMAIIESKI